MKRLGGMTDAAAGVHRRAREHGGVAADGARAAGAARIGPNGRQQLAASIKNGRRRLENVC